MNAAPMITADRRKPIRNFVCTSLTRSLRPQCCLYQPLDLVPVLLQDRPKRLNKIVRIAQEFLLILPLLTVEKPLGPKLKELRSGGESSSNRESVSFSASKPLALSFSSSSSKASRRETYFSSLSSFARRRSNSSMGSGADMASSSVSVCYAASYRIPRQPYGKDDASVRQ